MSPQAGTPPPQTITIVEGLRSVIVPGTRVAWDRSHGERHLCPVCAADLMREAVVHLAYTHEVCTCGTPAFDHLVQQLWHRRCLRLEVSA